MPSASVSPATKPAPEPQADAGTLTCSCEEWLLSRSRFRRGDPRRLCRHLCAALGQNMVLLPENLMPFAPLITRMKAEGQGIPFATPTFAFVLGDSGYLITMTAETKPWATVHVGGADYAFHVGTGLWDEAGRPPFASDIGGLIQAEIRRRSQKQQEPEEPAA